MGQYAAMIRVIACIVAVSLFTYFVYDYGYTRAEKKSLENDQASIAKMAESLAAEQVRSAELNGQVQQLLSRKPAKETIRELVNANPSDCVRPAAVTAGVQNEIHRANQAIAASRNGDSLQADPAGK